MESNKINTHPLFSIITINFNNSEGLKKTIESVLNQDFSDYEYIIIDGGSSDSSKDVIESYVNNPEFKGKITYWCSEPDKGIYNAMNKGLSHANGEFIALLNSGDWYQENILSKLAPIAKENSDSILYGAIKDYKDGIFVHVEGRSAECLPQYMIAHPTCFVPKAIYDKYGPYDENFRIAGDYELFLKFYVNKIKFLWTDLIITNFDLSGISNTSDKLLGELDEIHKRYGFYIEPSKKEIRKKQIKAFIKKLIRW